MARSKSKTKTQVVHEARLDHAVRELLRSPLLAVFRPAPAKRNVFEGVRTNVLAKRLAGVRPVRSRIAVGPLRGKPATLLDLKPKPVQTAKKKLCKCRHERSVAQKNQSRRFFGGYGGRGTRRPQEHVCHC